MAFESAAGAAVPNAATAAGAAALAPGADNAPGAGDGWALRADVPEGIFSLAVEADDAAAAAEHAAFAERCRPVLSRAAGGDQGREAELEAELITQLGWLRAEVAVSGLGYLGAVAGERGAERPAGRPAGAAGGQPEDNSKRRGSAQGGRPTLILLAIAVTPMTFPAGIDPASLLAALLRQRYPAADVEEFTTAQGAGAGMRRCESGPGLAGGTSLDTGVSQALVPFAEAGLLATVTGFCFGASDIDLATVFTATVAYRLRVARA